MGIDLDDQKIGFIVPSSVVRVMNRFLQRSSMWNYSQETSTNCFLNILGSDYRQKLRKNLIMRNVFRQMCEQSPQDGPKVLQPFNKCFRNLELLYDHCNNAVEGREGYVKM